jgi:hypothetical protein
MLDVYIMTIEGNVFSCITVRFYRVILNYT